MLKMSCLSITFAICLSLCSGWADVSAAVKGISLTQLEGNWAGEGSATFVVCFNSDLSAIEDCSSATNNAVYSQTFITQGTIDKNGNYCQTTTITNGPEFPSVPAAPANAFTLIQVGKTTSYTPLTGSGNASFTNYNANTGTSCNGAVLVNTGDAPAVGTGTASFVISQKSSREDTITTSVQNAPVSDVEDYVGHNVSFKQ